MKDKSTFDKSIDVQKLFNKIVSKPQEYLEQFETILDEMPVDPEHDVMNLNLSDFYHCKICGAQFTQSIHFSIVHDMTLDEYMEKFYYISPKIKGILFILNYNCLIQLIESYSLESFEVEHYSKDEIQIFLQHFYMIHNYNLNKIEDLYGIDFFPFIQAFDLSVDYLYYILYRNNEIFIPGIEIIPEYKKEVTSLIFAETECPICHETFKINGMKRHLEQIHDISIEGFFHKKHKIPYIEEKIGICSYQDFMFLVNKKQEMNLPYPLVVYICSNISIASQNARKLGLCQTQIELLEFLFEARSRFAEFVEFRQNARNVAVQR